VPRGVLGRAALRRIAALAAAAALGGIASAGLRGAHPTTAAEVNTAAISPPFAAVPRFRMARAVPRTLGFAPPPTCNPGPERIAPGSHNVFIDLPLTRVATQINNPTDQAFDALELRTYSGCLTSPLIEVEPGDTLNIAVHNELSADDPTCGATPAPYLQLPVGVGCFNTTNLHTHGLHVSPSGNSDNVLRRMPPSTTPYPVQIALRPDHPAGTFWYHAHEHGSTAVGVSSADAGVLIVRGNRDWAHRAQHGGIVDIDTVLHGPDGVPFTDTVFLLQQLAYACFWQPTTPAGGVSGPYDNLITTQGLYTTADANSNAPPPSAGAPWTCAYTSQVPGTITKGVVENFDSQLFSPRIWDTNGRFTSINGAVQPSITLPAGALQRWRFVHAGIHDTINLQVLRMTNQPAANGTPFSLAARLAGKTRVQQAAIIKRVCVASASAVVPQIEIAVDGLTRAKVNTIALAPPAIAPIIGPTASNYLQPGYRSDILVAFPSAGDYCLLDQQASPSERVVVNPKTGRSSGGGAGPTIPQLLAYIHVSGGTPIKGDVRTYILNTIAAGNPTLPASVRTGLQGGDLTPFTPFAELAPPHPQLQPAPTAFLGIGSIAPNGFGVNGVGYDPNMIQPALIRQLNTTDDWDVAIAHTGADEPHIFHIHVNPFEIIDVKKVTTVDGKTVKQSIFDPKTGACNALAAQDSRQLADQYCGQYHVFRDTLFIQNGYDVTLRTKYTDFTGEFVLHCHILDHEDAGMMANVQIATDRLNPPPPSHVSMPTMHMGAMRQAPQQTVAHAAPALPTMQHAASH
jgi:FtsP/CotA-like multicopper oxidase with cupredoxin domain